MDKFVPYEKSSKKRRRELDKEKRGDWNGVNPCTRIIKDKTIYDRKRWCPARSTQEE